ncbi:MAG: hypothetical protein FJW30_28395, partial [Acidobacteria bacterium]|nr:hypothetical protein [Acidobacteriota bacterium]
MPETESLLSFLAHVRRRYVTTELVRNGMTALTFGLGGLVVLLLAGTQIFDWYWPAALFAGAAVAGIVQFRRRMPDRYRIAQIADHRLGLHDALSTALNFLPENGPLVEWQRARAGRLAATLSAGHAVPM